MSPLPQVQIGLEHCLEDPPASLRGARLGLLMNQASVDQQRRYSCDRLAHRFPGQLVAMFSPQHGLWCEQQDNMIETPHGIYEPLNVPLYSLYSETRKPTSEMLADLDCFVIDLQDVGTRVYTFIWTVTNCLEACAKAGIPVVILDRPNPLGGSVIEGPLLDPEFRSFVGLASIPMRHGLTIGEFALWINQESDLGAAIDVVSMNGWERAMQWPDTGLTWLPPSPNMPRFETALVYPGQVLLEGTNLSEGRGTTTPFEIMGAPYVAPYELAKVLQRIETPGITLLPVRFRPTFNKWALQSCGGAFLSATNRHEVRSYRTTLDLIAEIQRSWPNDFGLNSPPYEYEAEKLPIDILTGSNRLSTLLAEGTLNSADIDELSLANANEWEQRTAEIRLY